MPRLVLRSSVKEVLWSFQASVTNEKSKISIPWDLAGASKVSPLLSVKGVNLSSAGDGIPLKKKIVLFIPSTYFGCAGSSLLRGLFFSCRERGRLSAAECGLLIATPSLGAAPRPWITGSVAAVHGLSSCGTRDLPGSGIKPPPSARQVDSSPLSRQRSPWGPQISGNLLQLKARMITLL